VVKQLTLLDSPEDEGAGDTLIPSDLDAANLLILPLAQLLDPSLKEAQNPTVTVPIPFVDSYFSEFGDNYRNYTVNDPDQGLNSVDLGNIFDVGLTPYPYHNTPNGIGLQHSYAGAWYAGSATAPGYTTNPNVGLLWSPLLSKPGTPFDSEQS